MRIYESVDSIPTGFWYVTQDPVGTVHQDGFGDDTVVVEIPDELWVKYTEARQEIQKIIKRGQGAPHGNLRRQ